MSMASLSRRIQAIEAWDGNANRQLMVIVEASPNTSSDEVERLANKALTEQDREIPKRHILRFNCGARESVIVRGK